MTTHTYIWQMTDGRWHISAIGGRAQAEITADNMWIWRTGLDCGFETKAEAVAALATARLRWT